MSRALDVFEDGTTGAVIAKLPRAGGALVIHARGGEYPGARLVSYSGQAYIAAVVDVRAHEIETVLASIAQAAATLDTRPRGRRADRCERDDRSDRSRRR